MSKPNRKKQQTIPLHTAELAGSPGFRIEYFDMSSEELHDPAREAHRDDHYVFYVQHQGFCEVMIDFERMRLEGTGAGYICPGQIHQYLGRNSSGWFVAADASVLNNPTRNLLEHGRPACQYVKLEENSPLMQCASLLLHQAQQSSTHALNANTQLSLLQAFTGMLATAVDNAWIGNNNRQSGRTDTLVQEFRKLVKAHFLMARSAGQYALMLNISTSYLNEIVKLHTGFTASYWIQQEIFLEARRLLVHTDLTAKEIAYRTGYDDPTYFSRLFKKVTGFSPLDFRIMHLDLSNQNR